MSQPQHDYDDSEADDAPAAEGESSKALAASDNLTKALEQRGYTMADWRVFTEIIWPGAQSPEAVFMAIDYCRARHLDPLKRVVHIVPMWSRRYSRMVETVWPGIAEIRTTAQRTGEYVGFDGPEWGPMIEREFEWEVSGGKDKAKKKVTQTIRYPEWCKITVKRRHKSGMIGTYPAIVFWEEAYATADRFTDAPNEMWRKRTRGQLMKCTEAAGLREAFPEEIGNELTAEEMAGQVIDMEAYREERNKRSSDQVPSAPSPSDFQGETRSSAPALEHRSEPTVGTMPSKATREPVTIDARGEHIDNAPPDNERRSTPAASERPVQRETAGKPAGGTPDFITFKKTIENELADSNSHSEIEQCLVKNNQQVLSLAAREQAEIRRLFAIRRDRVLKAGKEATNA